MYGQDYGLGLVYFLVQESELVHTSGKSPRDPQRLPETPRDPQRPQRPSETPIDPHRPTETLRDTQRHS
ncbi:hypothetical protein EYF80_068310 [Liparis tanakae]|uniref:Uncharacterized protein n=1 Tax=Liparis tanakae TaxID=230148 RepID=A0A4Z2DYS4_9TELE|nr:hypothetical protein EYF80_068310 [Liparis tanakae]